MKIDYEQNINNLELELEKKEGSYTETDSRNVYDYK